MERYCTPAIIRSAARHADISRVRRCSRRCGRGIAGSPRTGTGFIAGFLSGEGLGNIFSDTTGTASTGFSRIEATLGKLAAAA
jgi:hypothetical protein